MIPTADGRVLLLFKDRRRGTWLTLAEVGDMGAYIAHEAAPTERLLRLSMWLNFPFALALLGICANTDIGRSIDAFGQIASIASGLLILAGLPLFMLTRHYLVMRRVMAHVEAQISSRPAVDAPPSISKRGLDTLETVGLLLVAPNLIASLVCWIDPDALRNTPMTGSTLSPLSGAVLLALAVRRAAGRSGRQFRSAQPLPPGRSRRSTSIIGSHDNSLSAHKGNP